VQPMVQSGILSRLRGRVSARHRENAVGTPLLIAVDFEGSDRDANTFFGIHRHYLETAAGL
jgi:hypothetical protein